MRHVAQTSASSMRHFSDDLCAHRAIGWNTADILLVQSSCIFATISPSLSWKNTPMTHCWLNLPRLSFLHRFAVGCLASFVLVHSALYFFVKSQWNSLVKPQNQPTVAWDCLRHQPLFLPVDKDVHSCWLSSPNFCWEAILSKSRVISTRPNWYPCYASIRTMCVLNPVLPVIYPFDLMFLAESPYDGHWTAEHEPLVVQWLTSLDHFR